ncbi:MAG TPA: stage II sporulation protein P [Bacilli bacterium]
MKRTGGIGAIPFGQLGGGAKTMVQTWTILSFLSLCFFILLFIAGYVQFKTFTSPVSSMKGLSASVSGKFFADMLWMEFPAVTGIHEASTFSGKRISQFLFALLTGVNPANPKTLLSGEIPGLRDDTIVLRAGSGTDFSRFPADYPPSQDTLHNSGNSDGPKDAMIVPGDEEKKHIPQQTNEPPSPEPSAAQAAAPPAGENSALSTGGRKVVFIYHSHNRESWIPELRARGKKVNGKPVQSINDAYDAQFNITLVGERLAKDLNEAGVGAQASNTDYYTAEKDFNYNYSYKYSLQTIKAAFAANPNYDFFFDIHRDSQKRGYTTVTINGKTYAQIWFIIGHENPNWQKNEQLASKLHNRLEEMMPGLSKGIFGKGSNTGNGEYNQSFSPNSVLIEIGGPENTLAECYRTADILAKAISDIYWDARKAAAPAAN